MTTWDENHCHFYFLKHCLKFHILYNETDVINKLIFKVNTCFLNDDIIILAITNIVIVVVVDTNRDINLKENIFF